MSSIGKRMSVSCGCLVLFLGSTLAQNTNNTQPPSKTTPVPPAKQATATPPKPGSTPDKPGMTAVKAEIKTPNKTTSTSKERLVTYTFDGVKLEGTFYPPLDDKGRKTPCLILLHAVGSRHLAASRKDFEKLPEILQKLGYAVATFDFRGYGESKTVNAQEFARYNRLAKTKNPEHIEARDYQTSMDLLYLVNDLVAIKTWLNKKNNSGDCNSNVIGIVASEQAALVATAFIANELSDPNRAKDKKASTVFIPGVGAVQNVPTTPPGGLGSGDSRLGGQNQAMGRMEGDDIACLVAISSTNRLNEALPMNVMEYWLSALRDRQIPVVAVYGVNDRDATAFWTKAVNWIKPPREKERYKQSGVKPIRNTSLSGVKLLLNDSLEVPKFLETYFQDTIKKTGEARIWTEQPTDLPNPVDLQRLFR